MAYRDGATGVRKDSSEATLLTIINAQPERLGK